MLTDINLNLFRASVVPDTITGYDAVQTLKVASINNTPALPALCTMVVVESFITNSFNSSESHALFFEVSYAEELMAHR
jgi:hypothetical protein